MLEHTFAAGSYNWLLLNTLLMYFNQCSGLNMDPINQLIRTCNGCGIEKPLGAFLQLSGAHGTSYGKICANCRGIGKIEKPASVSSEGEHSTMSSGIRLGGKEKIYADAHRLEKVLTLKSQNQKEEIKQEDIKKEKDHSIGLKEESEKKHREFYIEPKKQQAFLSKKPPASQQNLTRQQTQKLIAARTVREREKVTLAIKQKEQTERIKGIAKEESKKRTTNFSLLHHAITPRTEWSSQGVLQMLSWLPDSPIVRALKKAAGKNTPAKQPELVIDSKTPSSRRRR
jgi:hypothetical protein